MADPVEAAVVENSNSDETNKNNSNPNPGNNNKPKAEVILDDDDDDYVKNLMNKQANARSKANAENTTGSGPNGESTEAELEAEIKGLSEDEDSKMSVGDLYAAAEFAIELLDTFASEGARYWSKEPTAEQFELPERKKKKLAKLLAALLYRWQVKLGPGAAFMLMCALYFGGSFKKAHKIRQQKKAAEERKVVVKKDRVKLIKKKAVSPQPEKPTIFTILKKEPASIGEIISALKAGGVVGVKYHVVYKDLKRFVIEDKIRVDTTKKPQLYFLPKKESENVKKNK